MKAMKAIHDLKVLKGTSNRKLKVLIKARHPLWSDEIIEEEVKKLRSPEFAQWYRELFNSIALDEEDK